MLNKSKCPLMKPNSPLQPISSQEKLQETPPCQMKKNYANQTDNIGADKCKSSDQNNIGAVEASEQGMGLQVHNSSEIPSLHQRRWSRRFSHCTKTYKEDTEKRCSLTVMRKKTSHGMVHLLS
ncbi:hypothetical protein FGO68_gene16556 [Halteria grandinella]|uniref:Uncharacterized protein n=1 Tax=Halteria grandinella TaxID=5974 RepID=A0A8J8NWZ8_HALGN|nr:hypothetical protein FGO68_gene16556 [Halteria grandinella]